MQANNGWTATHSLDSFDCTLANLAEVVLVCLNAAEARSVVEVGAENGSLSRVVLSSPGGKVPGEISGDGGRWTAQENLEPGSPRELEVRLAAADEIS